MLTSPATRTHREPPTHDAGVPGTRESRRRRRRAVGFVVLAATLAVAAWLPFLQTPLTSDESGFAFLGLHWAPGTSLYGDYWVDRPPLLVWLFSLAGHVTPIVQTTAGPTAPAVKLLGAFASGLSVILAGVVARLASPHRSRVAAAVTVTAVLSCSPLLGMPETDGEVLAVPFVLLGLALLLGTLRCAHGRRALLLAAGAGASGICAAMVKQNVVDVFVVGFLALLAARGRTTGLAARTAAFAGGSLCALGVLVAVAAAHGTSPSGLWNAVFVFRLQAFAVIGSAASSATLGRMAGLAGAILISGAAVLLGVTLWALLAGHRRRSGGPRVTGLGDDGLPDLTWPALANVGWELCGVTLGGSYWWHYLTGLLPGLVLLVSLAWPVRAGRMRALAVACLAYAAVASLSTWAYRATEPHTVSDDARVESFLHAHAEPSDGVVVAFGHPGIVAGSGLSSPYPQLWSLPVRVRDPRLLELKRVLAGPLAPRWMVVAGASLDTWGLNAETTQEYLQRHYIDRVTYGDWHIWQRVKGPRR